MGFKWHIRPEGLIYKTFHPKVTDSTFFSLANGTFSSIGHKWGHNKSLNKPKITEIISSIFSNHNGMKLEINCKKKTGKLKDMWRLNNMILNNKCVKGEIK